MEVFPIFESYWSEEAEDMIDTGVVIGYESRDRQGRLLGTGETVAEAIEAAMRALYIPEAMKSRRTS